LGGSQFTKLLQFIRDKDPQALILVDLPPVLATADALVVLPNVSATLLVVAEGKTRRDGLAKSLDVLSDRPIAGVVLNYSRESFGSYYG
jgi:Mrp family chromosome partitioning ATPase